MKKSKTKTYVIVLFFFIGLITLFYPSISNYTNSKIQSKAITNYEELIQGTEEKDYSKYFEEADKYNNDLMKIKNPLVKRKLKIGNPKEILNVDGHGMMGYLTIDKINVELPIYYGTGEDILSRSVGVLEGSSLPVGGIGTHSVLLAHRGLPSSKLFTNLDDLEEGDTFAIKVYDRTITYEVDQILIVEPEDIKELAIDSEKDYVTLMTCTPYGINTHRLLVRGHRVDNIRGTKYISTEAFKIDKLIVIPIMCLPILILWLLSIALMPVEKRSDYKLQYVYPTEYKNMLKKQQLNKPLKKKGR